MTRAIVQEAAQSREVVIGGSDVVEAGSAYPTGGGRPDSSGRPKATILELHGYRVGNTLGHGSYATVKEAFSQKHNMKVAIKIISKKRAPNDYLQKFLPREIDIIRKLKHPSLILNIQCIETNNRVYIIMENACNGDLLNIIRTQKCIPEKQAALWFCQLADGIIYCHSIGVVHRDLKCENLILDRHNNLKICDFGFARDSMVQPDGRFVLSETYCGSYAYAPPEILTGTPYVGQLADVWSTGVILYVMVFGSLPFEDANHRELLRQVKRGPEFPTRADRQASQKCKNLIKRILVKRELRCTMATARMDPWCREYGPPLPDPPRAQSPAPAPPRPRTSEGSRNKVAPAAQGEDREKATQRTPIDETSKSEEGYLTAESSHK